MTTTTAKESPEQTAGHAQGGPVATGITVREPVNSHEEPEPGKGPILGDIIVKTHDGARCVAWTLGHGAAWHGLTPAGISAAARATADFLDGLDEWERTALDQAAGVTQIRIGVLEWSVPLLPHLAPAIERMMLGVINAEGSIGLVG